MRESFEPGTDHGGHDGEDGRAIRYLEWVRDEDPDDSLYEVDLVYTLKEADGSVRVEHDHCVEGLVRRRRSGWRRCGRRGFEASTYPPFEPEEYPGQRIFIGKRPA